MKTALHINMARDVIVLSAIVQSPLVASWQRWYTT
jgi:hypothetical protein